MQTFQKGRGLNDSSCAQYVLGGIDAGAATAAVLLCSLWVVILFLLCFFLLFCFASCFGCCYFIDLNVLILKIFPCYFPICLFLLVWCRFPLDWLCCLVVVMVFLADLLCGRCWSLCSWGCKPRLLASCFKNAPKQICMRSGVRNMLFLLSGLNMTQCFAGYVLQGSCILDWIAAGQWCILRASNLNHPHTLQRCWSTALLP